MARGEYGRIDREQHPFLGWGEDRLVSYAKGRAVGAALQPILPYVPGADKAMRLRRGIGWVHAAGNLAGGRREADKSFAQIGGEFYHSIADRQRAIIRISSDFRSLASDLAIWHQANAETPNASSVAQWIAADVTPTLEEWREFVECEDKSWWTKAATKWETFEDWQDRLRRLRGLARAHGATLESSEPKDLPKTIWERSAEGKGGEGAALLGVLKIAVAAALGVTGFVTMYAVVRELKGSPKTVVIEAEHPEAGVEPHAE